jgi:hypothetical protein
VGNGRIGDFDGSRGGKTGFRFGTQSFNAIRQIMEGAMFAWQIGCGVDALQNQWVELDYSTLLLRRRH